VNAWVALAAFVSAAERDLPGDVRAAAKTVILDGLANLAAGGVQPGAVVVRRYAASRAGVPQAVVAGQGQRLPAADAAWCNGAFMHCLDYEVQGYPSAHGTSSILPAALALADTHGASGETLLAAFVRGWDVQQRLRSAGASAPALRVFHPPGVVGPLGAAAAAAVVRGLDAEMTRGALGYAASQAGGLFANNGTMTKATHPAMAARAGVEGAELAALGLTTNPSILEDPRGYVRAFFGDDFDQEALLSGLGVRYHLVDPGFSIKPYPAEIYMQWPTEAAHVLRHEHGVDPAEVDEVVVEPPVFRDDLSRPLPESGLDGKFSYEYCVAVALACEEVTIASFTDPVRFSAPVVDMLGRIRLRENPAISADKQGTWARVTVRLADGRELTETCRRYPGAIGRRMERERHLAKVRDCFAVAGVADRADDVIGLVDRLDQLDDVGELTALLR
jgi:2-methylcitrate dehydratase PrpD